MSVVIGQFQLSVNTRMWDVACRSENTPGCLTLCGEECLTPVLESSLAASLAVLNDALGSLASALSAA